MNMTQIRCACVFFSKIVKFRITFRDKIDNFDIPRAPRYFFARIDTKRI